MLLFSFGIFKFLCIVFRAMFQASGRRGWWALGWQSMRTWSVVSPWSQTLPVCILFISDHQVLLRFIPHHSAFTQPHSAPSWMSGMSLPFSRMGRFPQPFQPKPASFRTCLSSWVLVCTTHVVIASFCNLDVLLPSQPPCDWRLSPPLGVRGSEAGRARIREERTLLLSLSLSLTLS